MLILATFSVAFGLIALAVLEMLGVLPATMMAWLVGAVSAGWVLAALWCAWLDWSFRK